MKNELPEAVSLDDFLKQPIPKRKYKCWKVEKGGISSTVVSYHVRFEDSDSEILDWIFHMHDKPWVTLEAFDELVDILKMKKWGYL